MIINDIIQQKFELHSNGNTIPKYSLCIKSSNSGDDCPPEGNCTNTRHSEFVQFLLYECFGVRITITDILPKPPKGAWGERYLSASAFASLTVRIFFDVFAERYSLKMFIKGIISFPRCLRSIKKAPCRIHQRR